MLSKSLIKGYQVMLKEKDPRIVDSNDLIAQKMEKLYNSESSMSSGGFHSGLGAVEVDVLLTEDEDSQGAILTQTPSEPVYTGPSPEELVAQAQAEIEEMKNSARDEMESMRVHTLEESRKEGYQAGYIEGQKQAAQELEREKKQLKMKEAALEAEYQNRVSQLEPKFIETLTGIYEQVFMVDLADYKPILLHAIGASIRNIEGSRDFIVHVSREDYEAVNAGKAELVSGLGSLNATLEIIEDITLGANQCMIETSNGIYDCGIGSQLEELGRRLRLLSYEPH